jgi:hypothetical protein
MKYMHAFLEAERDRSNSADTYPEVPTKPTKLPGEDSEEGFVGFGGSQDHTFLICEDSPADPSPRPDTYAEALTKLTKPPDRSVWRSVVATWPIPERQEWADRAELHQAAGDPWNVAEWKAFQEMTRPPELERPEVEILPAEELASPDGRIGVIPSEGLTRALRWLSGVLGREPIERWQFHDLGNALLMESPFLDQAAAILDVKWTFDRGEELWSIP